MESSKPSLKFVRAVWKPPEADEAIGFTWWDRIAQEDVDQYVSALEAATGEQDMQAYLRDHPQLLIQHLRAGHGRWVHPSRRLGSEHVTDFVIGGRDSLGYHWIAVELESPKAKVFTNHGDPSARLVHAIRQIHDWRNWLTSNLDYARRPQSENGLGLIGIEPDVKALIIIGRDDSTPETTAARRRRMGNELDGEIHTYDWLVRQAQARASAVMGRWHPKMLPADGETKG